MNALLHAVQPPKPSAPCWQIPVASQGAGVLRTAHFFVRSKRTDERVQALCGRLFNPGFAIIASKDDRRCSSCEKRRGKS